MLRFSKRQPFGPNVNRNNEKYGFWLEENWLGKSFGLSFVARELAGSLLLSAKCTKVRSRLTN